MAAANGRTIHQDKAGLGCGVQLSVELLGADMTGGFGKKGRRANCLDLSLDGITIWLRSSIDKASPF
ncbi:MAG TPA: hypothetical protein VE398_12065 [Acidobacteriota bacterium]|nr:hypothetical protein [Acidobacteriota bacterium]